MSKQFAAPAPPHHPSAPSRPLSVNDSQHWATVINAGVARTVEGFIGVGQALLDAKAALQHGEWERMFKGHPSAVGEPIRFSLRTAQRLMLVAARLGKTPDMALLPPHLTALEEIARLPDEIRKAALLAGTISPDSEAIDLGKLAGLRRRQSGGFSMRGGFYQLGEEPAPAARPVSAPREPRVPVMYSVKAWESLSPTDRGRIIEEGFRATGEGMNKQTGPDIEWAQFSHNTVTGCLHDCPYCYARDIAEKWYPQGFAPTFHPNRLAGPGAVKVPPEAAADPSCKNVFANSMSDLFGQWVPADWIEATIEMARRNPQWNFLTLTKFPQRAIDFTFPDNWWMGTTVDAQARVANAEKAFERIQCETKWLSVEPLLEPLTLTRLDLFQWVVIGGASPSTKTPAWRPPFRWVAALHLAAEAAGCHVYHKTNLGPARTRDFPRLTRAELTLPEPFRYLKGRGA